MEDSAAIVAWVMDNALLLITAVFLPLLNGLVTRLDSRSWVKAAVNFVLALLTALVDQLVSSGGEFTWQAFLTAWMIVAGVSHQAYKMIWKPVGGGTADPVRVASPNTGMG